MEVSEEVAEMFKEFDRKEAAYRPVSYTHLDVYKRQPYIILHFGLDYENVMKFYIK